MSIIPSESVPDAEPLKVAVGMNGAGDHAVAWSRVDGFGALTVRPFARNGAARGPASDLEATAYFGSAAGMAKDGSFVVAWSDYAGWFSAAFRLESFDRSGRSKGMLHRGDGTGPAVSMRDDGSFVFAWSDYGALFAQRYDGGGRENGPVIGLNGTQPGRPGSPALALARDGSFVVAWQASRQNGSTVAVVARRFDAAGAPLGDDFQVDERDGFWPAPEPTSR